MRTVRWLPLATACLISACTTAPAAKSSANEEAHVAARVQELLNKYEAKDQAGVVALLDTKIPIRLATTWHKRDGEWYLTQSANSVMTAR